MILTKCTEYHEMLHEYEPVICINRFDPCLSVIVAVFKKNGCKEFSSFGALLWIWVFFVPTLQTRDSINITIILSFQHSSDERQRLHLHQKQNHPAVSGAHLHRPEGQSVLFGEAAVQTVSARFHEIHQNFTRFTVFETLSGSDAENPHMFSVWSCSCYRSWTEVRCLMWWPSGTVYFQALMMIMMMNQITAVYMHKVLLMMNLFQTSVVPKQTRTRESFYILTSFRFIP